MAKVVRAVVECEVPNHVAEKQLVWALKRILKYPIQLGINGDRATLVKPEFKAYSRVRGAEKRRAV